MTAPDTQVILYTRGNCSACREAELLLQSLAAAFGFRWRTVDVDGEEQAAIEYGDWVPLLRVVGGSQPLDLPLGGLPAGDVARALREALG